MSTEFWVTLIFSLLGSVLASTGLWTLIQRKLEKKDSRSKMILGLGHDKIMTLGMKYIERGWITYEEYEDLYKYLYRPYLAMGGNGSAKRIMDEVDRLPIKSSSYRGKEVETPYTSTLNYEKIDPDE